jgi:hypothetical protein
MSTAGIKAARRRQVNETPGDEIADPTFLSDA